MKSRNYASHKYEAAQLLDVNSSVLCIWGAAMSVAVQAKDAQKHPLANEMLIFCVHCSTCVECLSMSASKDISKVDHTCGVQLKSVASV